MAAKKKPKPLMQRIAAANPQKRNSSARDPKFQWYLLGGIALIYLIWFALYWCAFFIGDFVEQISEAEGINNLTDQHSILLTYFIKLLFGTGAGAIIYELIANIGLVFLMWYSLKILYDVGLSKRATIIIAAVYCFFPMFSFIANFMSKDQLFAITFFALTIKLYQVLKQQKNGWKDFAIIGGLFLLTILFKTFFAILIIAFAIFALFFKRYAKPLLICTGAALILGIAIQSILVSASGATSIAARDMLSVPNIVSGAIFSDPNANISDEERQYYFELYDNPYFTELYPEASASQWWGEYQGLISDHLKFPLWYTDKLSIPEYVLKTTGLCFKNFGTCVQGYLTLMSGFYLPIEISHPLTGNFRNPTYSQYTSDIGDNYISTSAVSVNSQRICPEITDTPLDGAGYKQCLIQNLGESEGSAVGDSVQPLIRPALFSNSLMPALAQAWVDLWHALKFFLEGFWLFWISVALLVISFVKRKYRKLRPFVMVIFAMYIGLFIVAPVAYERYLIPIYMILPFLIGAFWVEKTRKREK